MVDDDQPEIQSVVICGHLRNLWMKNDVVSFRRGLSADYTDLRRFLFQALILHDAMRGGVADDDLPEIQSGIIGARGAPYTMYDSG